jgi:hypothetical protein
MFLSSIAVFVFCTTARTTETYIKDGRNYIWVDEKDEDKNNGA